MVVLNGITLYTHKEGISHSCVYMRHWVLWVTEKNSTPQIGNTILLCEHRDDWGEEANIFIIPLPDVQHENTMSLSFGGVEPKSHNYK
jgi:hypothetical protein